MDKLEPKKENDFYKKPLDERYAEVYDYDPTDEEVLLSYDEEFNEWCNNRFHK